MRAKAVSIFIVLSMATTLSLADAESPKPTDEDVITVYESLIAAGSGTVVHKLHYRDNISIGTMGSHYSRTAEVCGPAEEFYCLRLSPIETKKSPRRLYCAFPRKSEVIAGDTWSLHGYSFEIIDILESDIFREGATYYLVDMRRGKAWKRMMYNVDAGVVMSIHLITSVPSASAPALSKHYPDDVLMLTQGKGMCARSWDEFAIK